MEVEHRIKETIIRYADIRAEKEEDYCRLTEESVYLVPAEYEETKEGLKFLFQIDELIPFTELAKEENLRKYSVLLKTMELKKLDKELAFSMSPDNLYYSLTGEVRILVRDIADKEDSREGQFLKKYKALLGAVLQSKYSYDDFMEGGESLLKKKRITVEIYEAQTEEQLQEILKERIEKEHESLLHEKQIVYKKTQRMLKTALIMLSVLTVAGAVFAGIYFGSIRPYDSAVKSAMNAYVENNYIAVIDAMKKIGLEQMDYHQKYILADAYINSENLSTEQKENILSNMTVNQNEKIFDYWIYIGRQNAVEAENIAMQLSDDELLIYAYLLDKKIVQTDTRMDGEEKKSRLAELDRKIEEYTEIIAEESNTEE